MTFTLVIPAPETLLQYTWLLMGIVFGHGFGKEVDQTIKNSEWFKNLEGWQRETLSRMLASVHHFWLGLLLVIYTPWEETVWFGWGLFVSDLPDVPNRYGITQFLRNLYKNINKA